MKLSERVDNLEKAIIAHLEESGGIRADLKWLKRAVVGIYGTIGLAALTALAEGMLRR